MNESRYGMASLADWVGKELGTSKWVTVDQERINTFARCTGDHQWIHVDVERAKKESPFGGPVAHGYLTLALLAETTMDIGVVPKDAVAAFNYGLDKVRFVAAVPVDSRVRVRSELAGADKVDDSTVNLTVKHTIEIDGVDKPAAVAEMIVRVVY
jgi:acyl dehydratase